MARSTSARPTASPYSESCPDDRFNQKMARSSPPQFPVGGDFTSLSFFLAFDTSEASVKKKRDGLYARLFRSSVLQSTLAARLAFNCDCYFAFRSFNRWFTRSLISPCVRENVSRRTGFSPIA